jgi:hypothetical protein
MCLQFMSINTQMSTLMGLGSGEGIEDQVLGKLNQLKVRVRHATVTHFTRAPTPHTLLLRLVVLYLVH